jgi:PncC family amidohydrolase
VSASGGDVESARELARRVVGRLRERAETVSAAESCTGGWLGRELTAEAGASDVFWGGVIVYADDAKVRLAGVPASLIEAHGAVSESVAAALADGIRQRARTDWAVAVTGVAGPGGGSPAKPVGTVWIAVSGAGGTTTERHDLPGDRRAVRAASVAAALDDLRLRLDPA